MNKEGKKKLSLLKSLMLERIKELSPKELAAYVSNGLTEMGFECVSTDNSKVKIYEQNGVVVKVEYQE